MVLKPPILAEQKGDTAHNGEILPRVLALRDVKEGSFCEGHPFARDVRRPRTSARNQSGLIPPGKSGRATAKSFPLEKIAHDVSRSRRLSREGRVQDGDRHHTREGAGRVTQDRRNSQAHQYQKYDRGVGAKEGIRGCGLIA